MKHSGFVHLHLHSQHSLLDGAIRPDKLIERAKEFKMPAVAMTDHGNLFGAIEFYRKAMKGGVKPIIGCEVYVAPGDRKDRTAPSRALGETTAYHLILLVKNLAGYRNLCKLLSAAYIEGFYYKPRIDKELLKAHSEGLIALSACLHGEVANLALRGEREKAEAVALEYKELFPDRRFFLEIQDNGMEEQVKVNKELISMSKKLDIPLVATNDCHYLDKEDAYNHEVLLCIQTGKTMNSPDRMKFATEEFYFKSPEQMIESFKDTPEAIANTIEIAERCNLELTFGENYLPEFPLPENETVDSLFEKESKDGLDARVEHIEAKAIAEGDDYRPDKWVYIERLKKELNVIKRMGFAGYFLIVKDFIDQSRKRGIPVGPGRGSAAGSLVAYSLGITNLDPIRYNLLFERFLNPDRISLPDIDIDFCFEGRDEIIRYVSEKYGTEKVAQIITFGQLKAKAAIRDVGRALDMPYGDVDRIAKLVPNTINITIEDAIKEEPELKKLISSDPAVAKLIEVARSLEGLPRHASTHAAGLVIGNMPLVEYMPLYKSKDDIITSQYPMTDVEAIGLVKFDFLGIKTLTLINKAVKEIERTQGVKLDIDNLPLADEPTYALLAAANTNGTFQLESSGMKELLRKLKPETFEDLMAAVALYRPGPLQSGMVDDFIKRKHKRIPIAYELPELEPILENTYGVMVYQEQVMEISKVVAGFTPGDADVLRKAMGKKVHEVMLDQRGRFLEGAKAKKVPAKKAEKIFDLMAHFAGYGFNKSHSAAYALIAFQTAYLKAHYPTEFMAALLSSNMGDTEKIMRYIAECKDTGIDILPPDCNESNVEFTVVGGKVRFGLGAIKNVGTAAIDAILEVRKEDGAFESMTDLLVRVDSRKANKKVMESLIKCGAFDFTGVTRAGLMAGLEGEMASAQATQRDREAGQTSIFDMLGGGEDGSKPIVESSGVAGKGVAEWPEKELLEYEKEILGFYITSHPLSGYAREIAIYSTASTDKLKQVRSGSDVTLAGIVTQLRETMTKKGSRMAFMNLEDLKGGIEVIVFADTFSKVRELLKSDTPVLVTGKLEKDTSNSDGVAYKIIASEVISIEDAAELRPKKTHIWADTDSIEDGTLEELKGILGEFSGKSPVFLHLLYPDKREVVIALPVELSISPKSEIFDKIKAVVSGAKITFT